jgi:hypothetical protein
MELASALDRVNDVLKSPPRKDETSNGTEPPIKTSPQLN